MTVASVAIMVSITMRYSSSSPFKEKQEKSGIYVPQMWYQSFFHRLFSRHQKYAKRGIKFAKLMKIDTRLLKLNRVDY